MEANLFTIKDLENLSGIKAHTIRIWEQRYNFLKPQRTTTNIRYYTSDELKTILNVSLLNKYGYKVSHINKLSDTEVQEKILALSQAEAQQERLVNELIQYMIELKLDKFEYTLDVTIATKGIEKAITYLVFPFLEKIGILWLTNHINPAQEHLVTNIIRQKLIVGIDKLSNLPTSQSKVVLFLPEGEYHELGLLYMHFLLKAKGVKVYYVGATIPTSDIKFLVNHLNPTYLYTHLTSVAKNFNFTRFLSTYHQEIPNVPLVISGYLASSNVKNLPSNIQLISTLKSVIDFISTL
ncbi:MAG: MerR family transcriptional regulator [Ferruginibacter sp.]|nr:MerR family transcriptional regulator [Ferruginibacter sp.]